MRATRLGPGLRIFWRIHRWVLRATGGRVGSRLGGMQVLPLETTGHSGRSRSVGLFFLEREGRYFVVGSYAGEDRDPAWARNLLAHPRAIVTVGGRSIPVVGRPLEGAQRAEMLDRFVQVDGSFAVYRDRTTREIPVIELRPEGV
jgi:deazaflavin-dependent oxidoreductase (nitroreductase family)